MRSAADLHALKICFSVGAGLSNRCTAAMQAPRYIRHTELMLSQASQLQHLISVALEIVNNPAFSPSGLPLAPVCRYTRRLSKVRQRVLPAMEINPILNTIKDLSERSETIRGYL
ncbi:hypothetical protein [Pseudomonas sp. Xaverov 259]|uniref:hypothetical protein n=1 Tax=Pseudomonas sp. Xaverov 259 TaxID=2666086 RepID=UPI001C5C9147|nr:hypothetical protein [Pseudomonas sp. Xaverov 259]